MSPLILGYILLEEEGEGLNEEYNTMSSYQPLRIKIMRCYFLSNQRYSLPQYKGVTLMLVPAVGVIFVAMAALIDNSLMLADAQITGPQAQSANNMSNSQGAKYLLF